MWDWINYMFYLAAIVVAFAVAIKQILLGLTLLKEHKFPDLLNSNSKDKPIANQIPSSYIALVAMGDIIIMSLILKLS
ncbi:MAG: hypothetical protein WBL87_05090 [Methanothrix sp.]